MLLKMCKITVPQLFTFLTRNSDFAHFFEYWTKLKIPSKIYKPLSSALVCFLLLLPCYWALKHREKRTCCISNLFPELLNTFAFYLFLPFLVVATLLFFALNSSQVSTHRLKGKGIYTRTTFFVLSKLIYRLHLKC